MHASRSRLFVVSLSCLTLLVAPELQAESLGIKALKTASVWCLDQVLSFAAGKALDYATGQDLRHQLEAEIPRLVELVAQKTGPERAAMQENLAAHREQLATLSRLLDSQGKGLAEIKADQQRLLRRIDSLGSRIGSLEQQVGRIDARMAEMEGRLRQIEDALIRDCLDLRYSPTLGADEYHVKEAPGAWSSDRFDSSAIALGLRLLLNSCSADLTQRGLLIQLSMVAHDLDRDLRLYATWKGVGEGGYTLGAPRMLARQEFPLFQPTYRTDGQVVELFFPYDEIPGLGSSDRLALALVLTHDGTVLYTLPDRVLSCVFGQRVQCRWGR